jgi:hypothetical protein
MTIEQAAELQARLSSGEATVEANEAALAKYSGLMSLSGYQRARAAWELGLRREVPMARAVLLTRLLML